MDAADDAAPVDRLAALIEHLGLHHSGPVRLIPEDPRAALDPAAAHAIAATIPEAELFADYIVPSVFNRSVAPAVSAAVSDAAIAARSRPSCRASCAT